LPGKCLTLPKSPITKDGLLQFLCNVTSNYL
jgi:hypothetical protein